MRGVFGSLMKYRHAPSAGTAEQED